MDFARPSLFLSKTPPSGDKNLPLAIVRGGPQDGWFLTLIEGAFDQELDDELTPEQVRNLRAICAKVIKLNFSHVKDVKTINSKIDRLVDAIITTKNLKDPFLAKLKKAAFKSFRAEGLQEINLWDGGCLEPIPAAPTKTTPLARDVLYVAGPSGSGKTTYVRSYARNFNRLFPDAPVYLISKLADDDSLAGIENLMPIVCDEELIENPIEADQFPEGPKLVVFDDVDTISNKAIRESVLHTRNDILEIGRHNDIYCCVTSHLLNRGHESRIMLNEAQYITSFPSSGNSHQIRYCLKNYAGISPKLIKRVFELPSRWVTVRKHFPTLIFHERGAFIA